MHTSIITIEFDTVEAARIVYESLRPELSKKIPQTKTTVTQSDNILKLTITAKTTPVLRAAINSYSRWIQTAFHVQQIEQE